MHKNHQEKQRYFYNKHCGKKSLPQLNDGQKVIIEHNKYVVPGKVIKKHHTPRSYIVETDERRRLRRNRKHLKQKKKAQFTDRSRFDDELIIPSETDSRKSVSQKSQSESENVLLGNKSDKEENTVSSNHSKLSSNQSTESAMCQTTKSGRVVKIPSKYDDFVCNLISEVFV